MHQFTLIVGDWSEDGHGITEEFTFMSNYALPDISKALVGCSLAESLTKECGGYRQDTYSKEFISSLEKEGILLTDKYATPSHYASLYLQIAKLRLPSLEWQMVSIPDYAVIGGYGLFEPGL